MKIVSRNQLSKISDLSDIFNIIEIVGGGSFGTVYRAIHIRSDKAKALKIGSKLESPYKSKYYQEIKILTAVDHPNIVSLEAVYESKKKICLVFEYCPRELSKVFKQEGYLNEPTVQKIMQYLTSAVAYLHSNSIVHRDLKLENILIGDNPENTNDAWFVKLCDFGVSTYKSGIGYGNMLNEFCGTPLYMAPEMEMKSYSEQCDIWSLGVIMFLLFEGEFPFQIRNSSKLREVISTTYIDYDHLKCSKPAAQLIHKCLQMNPAHRITAQEMLHSAWIKGKHITRVSPTPNILEMMDQYNALNADQRSADVGSQENSNLPPSNVITPRGSILGNLPKNDIKPSDVEAAPIEKKYPIIQITSVTKGAERNMTSK
ncbi:serine/threonine-protein kinase 33-like [Hermetia illucens]|uniref:serine/threonine-protein kinase 33-like n=1 Tax=Hermetia illucens TaxID=343691 RepID=UPI0018CC6E6B|nr:serine/threonine-protein kinase 33-like [Hermetia illucens]